MVTKYLQLLVAVILVVGLGCSKDRRSNKDKTKDNGERFAEAEKEDDKNGITKKMADGEEGAGAKRKPKKGGKGEPQDKDEEDSLGPNHAKQDSNIANRKKQHPDLPVRKIKYTADLKVIIEDLDKSQKELDKLIASIPKAYVSQSEINPSPGKVRHGSWKVRVPVDRFNSFRAQVAALGEVEVNKLDSEDLTEEFYDLQARIKNQKAEEESLRNLLVKTTKMEDHLSVRRSLKQLRMEIDRYQTRVKLIANLTDLTTVNVTLQEKRKYDPGKGPETAETPTLGMRISKTFEDSVEALSSFGQWLLLALIGVGPWLPVLAVIVVPIWWLIHRRLRSTEPMPALVVTEQENVPPTQAINEDRP
jgi:hypothetical protein